MTRLPREIIKRAAQDRIETVLRALGIDVVSRGGYITTVNTARGETGRNSPSLQIWTKLGYEGAWKDHGADLKGDVFDLVALFRGWSHESDRGFAKACDWLAGVLGLSDAAVPASEQQRDAARYRDDAARRIKEQAYKDEQARKASMAIWLKGNADITPLAAYFRPRGIDMRRLARPPGALRLIGSHQHRESGRSFPCMAALMTDGTTFRAVHRTWLTPDLTDKVKALGVAPARKIWPNFTGAVIPLARGASGLPLREANEAGIADDLVLVEGIEKGLAVAVADHAPRVWAFGALANLAHVPVPDCAASIIVAADNDTGNARAEALLQRGLDHLATFGRPVTVMRTPIGKDVDEFLKAGEDA